MDALEQKVQALGGYELIGEKLAARFGEILRKSDDWALFRINPLRFGQQHDLSQRAALDLFIHAARVGLFDFAFNQICMGCGGVAYSHESLNHVGEKATFHCTLCDVDWEGSLDDRLEVAFTLSRSVRHLAIDPYADLMSYTRTFFTGNVERSPEVIDSFTRYIFEFMCVAPDAKQVIKLKTRPGDHVGIVSIDSHSRVELVLKQGAPLQVELGFHPHGADLRQIDVGLGDVELTISNNKGTMIAGMVGDGFQMREVAMKHPPKWHAFVTGKMLLNSQSFRDLFRVQALAPDLKLNLKSLTLLFTDLKGSTELYDRTGDVYAYQVVQEHFRLLSEAVRRHDGAIVKTMGDAIMASFSTSRDAVAAAVEMIAGMEKVNAKVKADGHETGLKVGLHEGSALAVNAESRLDYFGQTVNIAARVQALAASGEIWITQPVLDSEGVGDALKKAGFGTERKVVALKGVGAPTPVFKLRSGA